MSHGPGRLQRELIVALRKQPMSHRMAAIHLYGKDVTPAEHSAVRRAVRKLAGQDQLVEHGMDAGGGRTWTTPETSKRRRAAFYRKWGGALKG